MDDTGRISIAEEPIPAPLRSHVVRLRTRLFDLDEGSLSPPRRWLVVTARFLWLVIRAFSRDRLQMRAASLSFSTLLAVVPALALAFAIAQAAGVFTSLRDETIMPFVEQTLGTGAGQDSQGVALLRSAILGILALVDDTSIAGLGITGTVVLVLAIWRVVRGVDEAFRHVFENRGPRRSAPQRFRAWLIVATVTPLGLAYAVTSASFSHGVAAMFAEHWIPILWARELLLFVLPPVVVTLTMLILYLELPDTDVRFRSALVGAVVAGLAWYGMQLAHVRFQVGLAQWNAIYSGFGAFPVLLASVQVSWVIVLIGAQLVALHQHSPTLRVLGAGARRDFVTLGAMGMEAALTLVGREKPMAGRELAVAIQADLPTLTVVLDSLEARGIVSSIQTRGQKRYLLAIDPRSLRTSDVLDAISRGPEVEFPWRDASPIVQRALELHRQAGDTSEHNVTLAELREQTADKTSSD